MKYISHLTLFIIISTVMVFAQEKNEPQYEGFIKNFKKDYFTLEMLFQVVADFQPERTMTGYNGFSISNMRLKMKGNLDESFGYFFQASFIVSPFLLDAVVRYKFADYLALDAGQFKAPFSKEFLTFAGDIDFVNRAQATAILSPKRQIGFQLGGNFANKLFEYKAGIFNGNGQNKLTNDNNTFMYVGRIAAKPKTENSSYEIGINAGFSKANEGTIFTKTFEGNRTFVGGDFRAEVHNFLFSTEVIMNKLEGTIDSVQSNKEPFGYHITLGFKPFQNHQFLFRYDNLSPDGIISDSEFYIVGYNFWPSKPTELQFNYIIDSKQTDFKNHWYLINLQVSL